MQKYIDMFQNIPNWLPFIGMMTGDAKPAPFLTRITEVSLPIIVAAIWMIPEIKTMSQMNTAAINAYAENMDKVSDRLETVIESNHRMQTSVAILENNMAIMGEKVDKIDDVATSKVRTTEGRLDSVERELRRLAR